MAKRECTFIRVNGSCGSQDVAAGILGRSFSIQDKLMHAATYEVPTAIAYSFESERDNFGHLVI